MAPVIRISDEVFRRLQQYGEPLVDTPSSVIEKILDRIESEKAMVRPSLNQQIDPPDDRTPAPSEGTGVYLAPAHVENLRATVLNAVKFSSIRSHLPDREVSLLQNVLTENGEFNAWAMTESSRAIYSSMRPNNAVLFTEKGSGKFSLGARVLAKIESRRLGEVLWRDVPNKPWSLVYLLRGVQPIQVSKQELLSELGYAENFVVPGITRVSTDKVEKALARQGIVANVLRALS